MIRFNSQTRVKLWQLLVVIAALSIGLGLLPQHIGIPILLLVEGVLIIAVVVLFLAPWVRRKIKK